MEYVEWFVLFIFVVNFFVRFLLTVYEYVQMRREYAWASESDSGEENASNTKSQPELAPQCMLPEIVVERAEIEKIELGVRMRKKKKMTVAMTCMALLFLTTLSLFVSPAQIIETFGSASALDGLHMRETKNAVTTRLSGVCYVIKDFDDFKNVIEILYENYLLGDSEDIQLFTEETNKFVNISMYFEKETSKISMPASGGEMDAIESPYSDAEYFDASNPFMSYSTYSTSTDADSLNMVNDGYHNEKKCTFQAYLEQLISYCNATTWDHFPFAYLVVVSIMFLLFECYMYFSH